MHIIFLRYWSFSQEPNFVTIFASATSCAYAVDTPAPLGWSEHAVSIPIVKRYIGRQCDSRPFPPG